MKVMLTLRLVVGAGATEPGACGDGREDGTEAEEVVASIAVVAEKQPRRRVAGAAFLA